MKKKKEKTHMESQRGTKVRATLGYLSDLSINLGHD